MTAPEGQFTPVYPPPPGLQWYWLLALGVLTYGLFLSCWLVYLSLWLLRVNRQREEFTLLTIFSLGAVIEVIDLAETVHGVWTDGWRYLIIQHASTGLSLPMQLIESVAYLVGIFMMRSLLQRHYRVREPIGLTLSGVMTFFFGVLYFQYHLHNIAEFRGRQESTLAV
jgi:hypothetical protein